MNSRIDRITFGSPLPRPIVWHAPLLPRAQDRRIRWERPQQPVTTTAREGVG